MKILYDTVAEIITITKELLKSHDIMDRESVWFGTMKQVYGCFTFNNIKLLTLKITLNNIKNNITKGREYYYALPIFN